VENAALRLALLGDCMLGRLVNDALRHEPPEYPWGDTLPILQGADWRFCNLECVISGRGEPWSAYPKPFHFRSAPKNVAVLSAARIDAVSLANNHVLDYGYDALEEMLEILDRAGILHAGAGRDFAEAARLATAVVGGVKLGLLAFTDNEPDWEATAGRAGVFYVPIDLRDPRAARLLKIVRDHAAAVDLLIVSAHWGPNWGYEPPREHVAFAHALVEAGAGVVFGHSSHVFRGIEFHRNRPIIYGAGNFVDDYAVDEIERNDQSFIYELETENATPRGLRLHPTVICHLQTRRANRPEGRRIAARMCQLCRALHTPATLSEEGTLAVGNAGE
jgi:poly-gamma-glutamate capsule biosynthesis protein CapA/YwtB (metallophosphatase superfamily)